MKKTALVVFFAALLCSSGYALPQMPFTPWGTLLIEGMPAPDGTPVKAYINGALYAEMAGGTVGSYYNLTIPGDDPDTPEIEGGTDGDRVIIKVDENVAIPYILWMEGDSGRYNLRIVLIEVINVSLAVCPATAGPLAYGSLDSGTNDVPATCQDSSGGALNITVEESTNVPVDVSVSGTDYNHTEISQGIPVENTSYGTSPLLTGAQMLDSSPALVWSYIGGNGSVVSNDLWFWLDVPDYFLPAGEYAGMYTLSAMRSVPE
jgi:hypothetical protein